MRVVYSYRPEEKKWATIRDEVDYIAEKFFMINDNDELEEIKPLNTDFYKKVFLLNKNGKYGVALINADHLIKQHVIYRYNGYTITIPVEYDSIEVFTNREWDFKRIAIVGVVYKAKKQNDIYMFGFYGERLSPKLAEYYSVTSIPDMGDFYIVSKDNKFGAVNGVRATRY